MKDSAGKRRPSKVAITVASGLVGFGAPLGLGLFVDLQHYFDTGTFYLLPTAFGLMAGAVLGLFTTLLGAFVGAFIEHIPRQPARRPPPR